MAVEYRPARAEEIRQFVYNDKVGFGASTADAEIDRMASDMLKPEQTLCVFEDGAMVSQMGTVPFVLRWNGRDIDCGGVTAVSTLPTHRRRGYLRGLMSRAFVTMRDSNQPVAMLWASMAAIYQRFGYGIAFTQYVTEFDPRLVRFVDDIAVPGRTRLVKSIDALPLVSEAYDRFAAARTLMLRRDAVRWQREVLRPWRPNAPPLLTVVYEEADEVLGYATYDVEQRPPGGAGPNEQISGIWAWLTPAAHRALVRHFTGYDLARSIGIYRMPVDDPLFHHVQEPRLLGIRAYDGTLVRIVDLPAALAGRGYDADGQLTFAFADDLCPWNSGTWQLTVEGGTARVKRTPAEPGVCFTPRALAILASGHLPATTLARIGLISAAAPRALAAADALFRTACAPLCLDGF